MSRMGPILLILTVLAFIASTALLALLPVMDPGPVLAASSRDALGAWPDLPSRALAPVDLPSLFLHPDSLALAGLLAAAWLALAHYAGMRWFAPPAGAVATQRGDGALVVGLLAGATWPWLLPSQPGLALLLAAVMLAGILCAALSGTRDGTGVRHSSALGFLAGWALLVWLAILTASLHTRLGLPSEVTTVLVMLAGLVLAVSVQLRLGYRIGFSVALIWGLIGIGASTMATDAAITTMTVLGIAIVAVALVRVAS